MAAIFPRFLPGFYADDSNARESRPACRCPVPSPIRPIMAFLALSFRESSKQTCLQPYSGVYSIETSGEDVLQALRRRSVVVSCSTAPGPRPRRSIGHRERGRGAFCDRSASVADSRINAVPGSNRRPRTRPIPPGETSRIFANQLNSNSSAVEAAAGWQNVFIAICRGED